jgi:hypothetical protein
MARTFNRDVRPTRKLRPIKFGDHGTRESKRA